MIWMHNVSISRVDRRNEGRHRSLRWMGNPKNRWAPTFHSQNSKLPQWGVEKNRGRRWKSGVRVHADHCRVYIESPFIRSSDDRSEVPMRLTKFSWEHFIGGDTGLPMSGVGSSDPQSEVPMEHYWAAESILSEEPWDFRPRSEVPTIGLFPAKSLLSEIKWNFRHMPEVPI